jgi:hypothetical protein
LPEDIFNCPSVDGLVQSFKTQVPAPEGLGKPPGDHSRVGTHRFSGQQQAIA